MSAIPAVRPGTTHWRMLTDTFTVGALNSGAKIAGAVKVAVMARYFGTGDSLDAFLIAFLLPAFASDVIAGCFTPALVPALVRVRAESGEGAMCRLASSAALACCGLMGVAALLLAFASPLLLPLLASGFPQPKLRETAELFYILLLCLPVSAFINVWRALLNSVGVFGLPAFAPITTPLAVIAGLWGFARYWGVYSLCAGTVAGMLVEAAVVGFAARARGLSLAPKWTGWTPELKSAWQQYLPLTAGVMISSACVIVDQAMASMLGAGGVSALSYGNKLVVVGLGIAATASGTVALPVFSRLAASGLWSNLRRTAMAYVVTALVVSVPVTALLIYYSEPIVRLLFERGAFHAPATSIVSTVQRYALLQVPFSLALALVIRLCAALRASSLLGRVAVLGFMANVAGNIVFMRWLGLAGIALSTAVVQAVSLIVLVVLLLRRERRLLR